MTPAAAAGLDLVLPRLPGRWAGCAVGGSARVFGRLGAARWGQRARTELAALGDRPSADRSADPDPVARLTPQELQVVRLAASGMGSQ